MRREVYGYLTVEAALVMPLVLLLYVWLLNCLFYQYDRALLEQEAVKLLITGTLPDGQDTGKFMWCEVSPAVITEGIYKQEVSLEANFQGVFFSNFTTRCSAYTVNREKVLRMKYRLIRWMENKEIE